VLTISETPANWTGLGWAGSRLRRHRDRARRDAERRSWSVLDASVRLAPYGDLGTITKFGMGRTVYRPER